MFHFDKIIPAHSTNSRVEHIYFAKVKKNYDECGTQ